MVRADAGMSAAIDVFGGDFDRAFTTRLEACVG